MALTCELKPFSFPEICQDPEPGFPLAKQILSFTPFKFETDGYEMLIGSHINLLSFNR